MHSKVNAMLGGHDVSVRAVDGVDECIAKEAIVIKHRGLKALPLSLDR